MKHVVKAVVLLGLVLFIWLAGKSPGQAQSGPQPVYLDIKVGHYSDVKLAGPAQVVCDDKSLVRVEDVRTALRLHGAKVGRTQCGFFSSNPSFPFHFIYIVTVLPAEGGG
jgi:hypothetical protein